MSSRNSDIKDISKKRYVIRVTMTSRMVALSGQFGHYKTLDHTK